jgi:hypothetical protein
MARFPITNLRMLLEKSSDTDLPREMVGFAAQLEVSLAVTNRRELSFRR